MEELCYLQALFVQAHVSQLLDVGELDFFIPLLVGGIYKKFSLSDNFLAF